MSGGLNLTTRWLVSWDYIKWYNDLYYSIFSSMCMFCRSLFVLFSLFYWPLCCLFFFDIRILITPLVSSNSFYTHYYFLPIFSMSLYCKHNITSAGGLLVPDGTNKTDRHDMTEILLKVTVNTITVILDRVNKILTLSSTTIDQSKNM